MGSSVTPRRPPHDRPSLPLSARALRSRLLRGCRTRNPSCFWAAIGLVLTNRVLAQSVVASREVILSAGSTHFDLVTRNPWEHWLLLSLVALLPCTGIRPGALHLRRSPRLDRPQDSLPALRTNPPSHALTVAEPLAAYETLRPRPAHRPPILDDLFCDLVTLLSKTILKCCSSC